MDYDVGRNAFSSTALSPSLPLSLSLFLAPFQRPLSNVCLRWRFNPGERPRLVPPLLISILIRRHLIRLEQRSPPTSVDRIYFKRCPISSNSSSRREFREGAPEGGCSIDINQAALSPRVNPRCPTLVTNIHFPPSSRSSAQLGEDFLTFPLIDARFIFTDETLIPSRKSCDLVASFLT